MSKTISLFVAAAITFWSLAASPAEKANLVEKAGESGTVKVDPRKMTFPPLEFEMPQAQRLELDNGMVVYLLPDRMLPIVNFQALIRTGQIYEPAEKKGLAALVGEVLREGGTEKMSSEEMNRKLEYLAASIGTGISREHGSANLFVLKQHLHLFCH